MKKLIISIFLAFGMNFGCFAANNATDVYLLAQSGDAAELKAVENIDVVDSDGNTALCSAIKFNDVDAYNILKKAGANTEHKCVKKIPSEQYKTFLQKVGAANKSWSFLGMGKWAWAAIGAGVAGGAVAAGMGGGGGGSGGSSNGGNGNNICQNQGFTSHEPCIEEDGWTQDRFCEDSSGQWYKCKPANCFGYQNSCNDGYEEVPGDTCKSGGETKVKCQLRTCPYQTTYCETGYHETGNTCLSGILTYVECEPDTCEGYNIDSPSNCPSGYVVSDTCLSGNVTKYKCDTPATCPYNTTECTGGWDETGNTCQSGETLYKECSPKMCPYTTTTCLTGFYPTGNTCQSGDDTYVECVFDTENYIEQDGNIYQRLNCVHGTQNANTCSCNSEGWEGDLCDTPHNCGSNYVSACLSGYDETGNTCLSGDSILVECEPTQCGANAHWEGTACVCDSGYGNYTYGVGCSLIPLNCVHGTQNGISCSCTDGWTGNLCDTAVDCGANFTQTSCSTGYNQTGTCNSGETTYVSCEPATCPYNTTSCTAGYHETGATCQSGETLYKECEPDTCEGFNYTEMESCPNGYELGSSCLSGTIMKYKCDTPATCPYTTTECTGGYTFSGETCQSGETTYIECEQIQCGVHSVWSESGCSCENGYQNWTPGVGCYPVSCGLNATQFGTDCYCNPGYTNWTVGYGCYQTLDCGVNATQVGDSCVCNSGYQDWTEGYGCYETRDCGLNATQSGGNCVCNSGYQEWTEGYGCYQILNCGANATQHGDSCQCNEGYENWSYGTGCTLIELECGINAVQNGTHCECLDGFSNWQEGIGCYLYGLFSDQNANLINNNYSGIVINNNSNGSVYDIYGMKLQANENYHYYAYNAKIEGTNQYWNYVNDAQHHVVDSTNTKVIRITNEGDNDIYGMHVSGNNTAINADSLVTTVTNGAADEATFTANGNMYVTNTGDGNIYGLYGKAINAHSKAIQDHNVMWFIRAIANGHITITNTGDGDMYGMYNGLYNAKSELEQNYGSLNKASSSAHGYINITNTGDGDVYGMYGTNINNAYSSGGLAEGHISINNTGNGNVYGMSGTGIINNANSSSAGGAILIRNDGTGNVYGMHTNNGDLISNGRLSNDSTNTSITIINKNNGLAYGMYNGSTAQHTSTNGSEITMQNLANGDAIGMYTNGRTLTNSGTININNVGTGTVIGILGNNNSNITNTGTINITRDEYTLAGTTYTPTTNPGSTVFGIYAKSGSTVNNSGTINITSNGSMYGIYTESGATITNTGTISLNGVSCDGATCSGASNYIPYIVLNGGTLYNSGLMMAPQMNLNSMGGNVVAGLGSQFVVDNELSGDLNISSELVQNGNQTTYIAADMIDAGDISGLNVRSASAMFDASVAENGHDVVMQMKDFGDLTDNKSLAAFLANNYAKGKGQDLFSTLKSMDNMSAFNGTLSGLTGLSTFTQFAHEDLSAMREISFSMNNKLFENSDRDSFDISDSTGYFSFSNSHNSGSGQYGISSEKIAENWKLGYGMAMANINTGDGDNMHRQNKMWLFYMPATYTNDGYELVVAPKAGFANSEYSRRGYNNINYEGYIEKRIFGLMNDLRYPLSFGNWTLAPDLAFNAIVYDQSGNEDGQEFSLVIPDDRTVSVETGFGLYTKYEKTFESGARLKLNSGLMAYREFGDSYDIKLGIRGMDGTFNLYNNDYVYRGAASLGFDYMAGRFHLYGNAQYFMDNDNYMNFKGGVSYRF
ncbi:MAG: hypothetical protein MJ165_01210 [Alphaproteobacteria bacterium]|nr:hypothetical protein [Alphaproteobacteria bacterium]